MKLVFLAGCLEGYPLSSILLLTVSWLTGGLEGVPPLVSHGPGRPEVIPAHRIHQNTIMMASRLSRSSCGFAGCHIPCLPMSFQHSPHSCSADVRLAMIPTGVPPRRSPMISHPFSRLNGPGMANLRLITHSILLQCPDYS